MGVLRVCALGLSHPTRMVKLAAVVAWDCEDFLVK